MYRCLSVSFQYMIHSFIRLTLVREQFPFVTTSHSSIFLFPSLFVSFLLSSFQVTSASYMQRFTDASVRSLTAAKRIKQLEGAVLQQQQSASSGPAAAATTNNQKGSGSSGGGSAAHAGNASAAADAMAAVLAGLEADAAPSSSSSGGSSGNNRKGRKAK